MVTGVFPAIICISPPFYLNLCSISYGKRGVFCMCIIALIFAFTCIFPPPISTIDGQADRFLGSV